MDEREPASVFDLPVWQYFLLMMLAFFGVMAIFNVVVLGQSISEEVAAEILCESHDLELLKHEFGLEKVVCLNLDVNSIGRNGVFVFEKDGVGE